MINREELQKQIDALLDNITDEEIVAWYDSHMQKDIAEFLGSGSYVELDAQPAVEPIVAVPKCWEIIAHTENTDAGDYPYGMAA